MTARLPGEAFAIVGDSEDPETWQLPHHRKSILRALKSKSDIEKTVDWELMGAAVTALFVGGNRRHKVEASPEQVLEAAMHLASHYRKAGRPPSSWKAPNRPAAQWQPEKQRPLRRGRARKCA